MATITRTLTPSPSPEVQMLHAHYVDMTKLALPLNAHRIQRWQSWQKEGNDFGHLDIVLQYLWDQIKSGHRRTGSLKFSNLIVERDKFAEDLALALNWADHNGIKARTRLRDKSKVKSDKGNTPTQEPEPEMTEAERLAFAEEFAALRSNSPQTLNHQPKTINL